MEILEMYKTLSDKDKLNLIEYCIFKSIYDVARNEYVELSDDIVKAIEEFAYDLYIEDSTYKLSQSEIGCFITECYINDNNFLEKVEDTSYSDILEAIDNNYYDFYKEKN